MIKVIDNIIAKKEQENIKNLMLGKHFPWYYLISSSFSTLFYWLERTSYNTFDIHACGYNSILVTITKYIPLIES